MADIVTKDDLLQKLRAYATTPDDDTIRIKEKIYQMFLSCPELLYALHEKELELELFDDDGNINWNPETHEPYGQWDRYFGENSNIRPYLFIPETQTTVRNYVCYQVSFDELARYNNTEKYCLITFNILINGKDAIDTLTGIPRHDLIASIIRENMAWSGITTSNAVPMQDKESTTDNNYIVRTIIYQATLPNSLVTTKNGLTRFTNKGKP